MLTELCLIESQAMVTLAIICKYSDFSIPDP